MKVLHVLSPQGAGDTGGVDRHVLDLTRTQVAQGMVSPLVAELGDKGFARQLRSAGVPALTVVDPYRPSAVRILADAVRSHGADVLHTHGYDADLVGAATVALLRGVGPPWVVTVHGLVWRPAANFVKTALDLASVGAGARAAMVSSSARHRRLRRCLPRPVVVYLPNGTDVPRLPYRAPDPRRPVIGYLGRLSPEKGVEHVLEVVALARRTVPELTCRILGAGDDLERLRAYASRLGVTGAVTFTGYLADPLPQLAELDVLLMMSRTEGTPRAVVEAMGLGVPVVATRVGGLPDLIRPASEGFLVPSGDVVAATLCTVSLLQDRDLHSRIAAAARSRQQRELTLGTMVRRCTDVYRTVVAGRGST